MSYHVTGFKKMTDDPKNAPFKEQGIDVYAICYEHDTHNASSLESTVVWAWRKGADRIVCEKCQ